MKNKLFAHLHIHNEFCLAGDTIVYNCIAHHAHGKVYRTDYTNLRTSKTIKHLYDSLQKNHKGGTTKYLAKVFDGKKFVRTKIKYITKSPAKQLYKVTTKSGKIIRTSIKHKFLSKKGWIRLEALSVGDLLACNGQPIYQDKNWLIKKYLNENLNQQQIADLCNVSRTSIKKWIKIHSLHKTKSQWMQGHYVNPETCKKISKVKSRHRKDLIKQGPPSISSSRDRIARGWHRKENKCERCSSVKNLLVHHKNRDILKNDQDNLETLCKSCHEKEHSACSWIARYEKIISIEKDLIEETYDIEVEHPAHNFVANGFIVHNSYLDGYGSAKSYIKRAKELGFEYIGLTNHGNVDGLLEWQKECDKQDIKPILGCELYIIPNMHKKVKGELRGHMTVLVKDLTGWVTLCRWLTKANLEGFYWRPRVDYDLILNSDLSGLIFLTGCAGSFLNLPGAEGFMDKFISKPDNLYLEVMPHDIPAQHKHHKHILREYDLPLVASNDCHYILEEDWEAQESLLAIQTNAKWTDEKRWTFGFKGLHLRTADEMVLAFKHQGDLERKQILTAMANSVIIAEQCCSFRIPKQDISLPKPPIKIEHSSEIGELIHRCYTALADIQRHDDERYTDRLEEELNLIQKKNFARYFLLVQDFVSQCKKQGWGIGPGRGSVSGSLIAYLLGITEGVDPIEYDLLFSRFISEHRIDYPDIDIDVEKRFRPNAVQYLYDTYGENNVCGISTGMRMKSKAAIRDIGRIFQLPVKEISAFAGAIYDGDQEGSAIEQAVRRTREGKDFERAYPKELALMIKLEGQLRQSGQHPAGIIISGEDLMLGTRCVLVNRSKKIVANWNMNDAEYCGLMKLDVLGLATISVLKETESLINRRERTDFWYHPESDCYFSGSDEDKEGNFHSDICDEIDFNLTKIPHGNKKVFELITDGHTAGIFQISARPLTKLCMEMGIESFNDIVAANALVRPGPSESGMTEQYIARKHGGKRNYIHPIHDKITKDTYGMLVYQEQIVQIISRMAGMSESDADQVRKVIGKKRDPKEFEPYKKKFIAGCKKEKTFSIKQAEEFWTGLLAWASYGFGKAHSTAYSLITYRTAWLKVYYPKEFLCATLTYGEYTEKGKDDQKKKQYIIDEAVTYGFKIMPPKTGISQAINWIAIDDILYASFVELKGIGDSNADKCVVSKERPRPKLQGFFKLKAPIEEKKKTKIEQILTDIQAYDSEAIPDDKILKEYLPFSIVKKRSQRPSRKSKRDKQAPTLKELKVKKISWNRDRGPLSCDLCSLRDEADNIVLSSPGRYNIAIVCEAPGGEENEQREGLVGPAGQLLWKHLSEYKINRRLVHVANVCKCYPSKTRTPSDKHIEACLPYLLEELKEIDCRLILACGNICLKALTGRTGGITKLSGQVEFVEEVNAWIVWCVHPSAVLRNREQNLKPFKVGISTFVRSMREFFN